MKIFYLQKEKVYYNTQLIMKSMHCEVDFLQESVYWARKKRPLSALKSVCIKHVNFRENVIMRCSY